MNLAAGRPLLARPALAYIAAALLLGAAASSALAAEAEVAIEDFAFHPDKITVKAGTTIVFRNRDDVPHIVAAAGDEFRSESLDKDDTFSFTFDKPGAYAYFCALHAKMQGEVIVTP